VGVLFADDRDVAWSELRVAVTGGAGFLGQALVPVLMARDAVEIVVPRSQQTDFTQESDAKRWMAAMRPDLLLHLAARVGGIGANQDAPGTFFYHNAMMGLLLIEQARLHGVGKFVAVGTICSYPKHTPTPFREASLWDGFPEETNAPYGIAKKIMQVQLDAYRRQYGMSGAYMLPVNLYGPNDNVDPRSSHVIPALIRKCCDAVERGERQIPAWGTGRATREFLYVDDAAEAIVRGAERLVEPDPVNIGSGSDISLRDLAALIARLCGFDGDIVWDPSQPDGQPKRLLDTSRAKALLDWQATTPLEEGLRRTIAWYRATRPAGVEA